MDMRACAVHCARMSPAWPCMGHDLLPLTPPPPVSRAPQIIPCTRAMAEGTLLAALESMYPAYEQPPLGTRRTLFLSGMYSSELVDVVGAYKDAGAGRSRMHRCMPRGACPGKLSRARHCDTTERQARMHACHKHVQCSIRRAAWQL